MKNSVNIINLSRIEELSDEQTMNIFGGSGTLTGETRSTPGGSPIPVIPGVWEPEAKDEIKPPHMTFFTSK